MHLFGIDQCIHTHSSAPMPSYCWLDDNTIVATVLPAGLGAPPVKPLAPSGPKVQDNSSGKKSQNRTYPDLLKVSRIVLHLPHVTLHPNQT